MLATESLDTQQVVELAEGVEIRLRVVGPLPRVGAYLIDGVVRGMLFLSGSLLLAVAGWAVHEKIAHGLMLIAWFLTDWLYPVIFEAGKHGATPGKRIVGLRVVQATGAPITLGQAVVRNFLRFIDGMPLFTYAFGVTSCLATRRFQRLGDLAAGTVVIYADRFPPLPAVTAASQLAPMPVPVALSADEERALVRFRERCELWSPARQVEIADQASVITGQTGPGGVRRLLAMAHWVQDKRG